MNLSIKDGVFYVDNLRFCLAGVGNGRNDLQPKRCEVSTQYSVAHKQELPHAFGLGWIGASYDCDCVLGSVLSRNGVLPSQGALSRLLAMLEVAEGNGSAIWLEVVN